MQSWVKAAEETRAFSRTTKFNISSGYSSISATLTSDSERLVCTEEMPLGCRVIVTYRIVGGQYAEQNWSTDNILEAAQSSSNLDNTAAPTTAHSDPLPSFPRLHVEEARTVFALKPITRLLQFKRGPIVKTQNLLQALEDLGRSEGDMAPVWVARLKDSVGVNHKRSSGNPKED